MSSEHRIEKISMLLKEELAKIIEHDYELPGTLITVTRITISLDKNYAVAYLSILGNEPKRALQILQKNIYNIQQGVNKKARMRPVPRISFKIDKEEFKREQVEKSIASLKKKGEI